LAREAGPKNDLSFAPITIFYLFENVFFWLLYLENNINYQNISANTIETKIICQIFGKTTFYKTKIREKCSAKSLWVTLNLPNLKFVSFIFLAKYDSDMCTRIAKSGLQSD
jgi:hypothetical protein